MAKYITSPKLFLFKGYVLFGIEILIFYIPEQCSCMVPNFYMRLTKAQTNHYYSLPQYQHVIANSAGNIA